MIKRLRIKFVAVNMSIVVIMLCVILGLVFHFTRSNLKSESIHMMQIIAGQPFELDVPGIPGTGEPDIRLPYFILHVGPGRELLATNGGYYDLSDDAFLDEIIEKVFSFEQDDGVIPEYNLRYYRQELPGTHCLVFADISSEISTLDNMTKNCVIVGILSFFAFLEISILLSKWAVHPVEEAWARQRQFVADASHELKTPLTVILTNAELADHDEYSQSERKQFIHNIQTVSKHMKVLIQQMLVLARADYGAEKPGISSFNFSMIVSHVLMVFEAVLFEAGHPLSVEIDDDIILSGDERQIAQVPEILLDNAVKYAADHGEIHVALKRNGRSHCLLTVANEGEAIPSEQLKDLFKRFYRGDTARGRDGSFGLGLSIAESVIIRHKGKIWAESKNGYNFFYVLLPM